MYKARTVLNTKSLKQIYFSFVHNYINYVNIAWASTHKSKLLSLFRQQKYALRIIFYEPKRTHTRPLMQNDKCAKYISNQHVTTCCIYV